MRNDKVDSSRKTQSGLFVVVACALLTITSIATRYFSFGRSVPSHVDCVTCRIVTKGTTSSLSTGVPHEGISSPDETIDNHLPKSTSFPMNETPVESTTVVDGTEKTIVDAKERRLHSSRCSRQLFPDFVWDEANFTSTHAHANQSRERPILTDVFVNANDELVALLNLYLGPNYHIARWNITVRGSDGSEEYQASDTFTAGFRLLILKFTMPSTVRLHSSLCVKVNAKCNMKYSKFANNSTCSFHTDKKIRN